MKFSGNISKLINLFGVGLTTKHQQEKCLLFTDTIFWYSKTDRYEYKQQYHEYREEHLNSKYTNEENGRRYRLQSMYGKGQGDPMRFGERIIIPPPSLHFRWTKDIINKALNECIIVFGKDGKVMPQFKDFLDKKTRNSFADNLELIY